MAAYVILGINCHDKREVPPIEIEDNERSKYRLSVLSGLKNRGVKDILILCADGLSEDRKAFATEQRAKEVLDAVAEKMDYSLSNFFLNRLNHKFCGI